jgi:hypothetical protein
MTKPANSAVFPGGSSTKKLEASDLDRVLQVIYLKGEGNHLLIKII